MAHDGIKRRIKERFQALLDGLPIEDDFEPPEEGQGVQSVHDGQGVPASEAEQQAQQQQQEARQQQQEAQPTEDGRQAKPRGRGKGGARQRKGRRQQAAEADAGAEAEGEAEPMQVDAPPVAAAGAAGTAGVNVDDLAQQAQQLNIQQGPLGEHQQQQGGPQPAGAQAAAAAEAAAGPAQQQGAGILPTGLLASVADHLAHLQGEPSWIVCDVPSLNRWIIPRSALQETAPSGWGCWVLLTAVHPPACPLAALLALQPALLAPA